ncbi:hypothetical protein [Effusibacillus pohliae]|uniref:hypothetical protein n=1 Tax=Effusibacillus pohliae TaxID=232270 RepID=UPI000373A10E|nr:hypothetical protein [Effusibacillus pohliae]
MSRRWINKPVCFDREDPEDAELYKFARSLDNFTALVKRWLRELREGVRTDIWGASVPLRDITQIDDKESVEVEVSQFL